MLLSNTKLAGPLVTGLKAGSGITITGNPASGVGEVTVALSGGKGSSPIIEAVAVETEIASTTATTLVTVTPTATTGYIIYGFFRTTATTDVTGTLTFYDASGASQTDTIVPKNSFAAGVYSIGPSFVAAGTGGAVALSLTAGTANQVYGSATILSV